MVSPIGLGTWQWGDYFVWRYGQGYSEPDLHEAFHLSLKAGISFFDTAEIYGRGRSEKLLGKFLPEASGPVVVATKFMPLPWRLHKGALKAALRASLKRLRLERVDLYQVHWPFPPRAVEVWADALADVVEAGLARAVGVSNYSADQMSRAHEVLARRGVMLASNQVEYNLINRRVERNGVLDRCRELGVTLIAYSPLAKGLLSGKYTPENPPPGLRRRLFHPADLEAIQPLIGLMREIGRPPCQVALNWLVSQGVIPIPGAKNARQAADNAAALGWRLTAEESLRLAHL
jgi:aryl-alcohol dehydrogenase-like predicted oxidoreductase